MTQLPGIKAHHSIITDECRKNRFDGGAFLEAMNRMQTVYERTCENTSIGKDMKIHIVMTVERVGR